MYSLGIATLTDLEHKLQIQFLQGYIKSPY